MKEPYEEGVAHHLDPESCADVREDMGEALTGEHTGRAIELRNHPFGVPTLSFYGEGNTTDDATRESFVGAAESRNDGMCGSSMRENRETPRPPSPDGGVGRSEKPSGRTSDMHGLGESDDLTVPAKRANKAEPSSAAESVAFGAIRGGKRIGRGKRHSHGRASDTGPAKRVDRTEWRTEGSAPEEGCAIHGPVAPHHTGTAREELLRAET